MHRIQIQAKDRELVDDFFLDFQEAHQQCESCLLALENTPEDVSLTASLFRAIHTIKGNLIYIGLKDLCPLLQSVEDILEQLRAGTLIYDDMLSDVVLLALDATKSLINESLYEQDSGISDASFREICHAIRAIPEKQGSDRNQAIYDAILFLDPNTTLPPPAAQVSTGDEHAFNSKVFNNSLIEFGVQPHQDLDFLANLIPTIEVRSPYWQGRTRRIARLALTMNDLAGRDIDPNQLTAAVYMHDISMAFLPLELLHKKENYSSQERRQVNGHARLSYDLLHRMSHWDSAAEMVLHHHEHCDGQGYPKGLTEMEICDGAKILAITDTFDACTHSRAHHTDLKRPLIRAVLEINRFAGSQFSQYWVDIFNKAVQNRTTHH